MLPGKPCDVEREETQVDQQPGNHPDNEPADKPGQGIPEERGDDLDDDLDDGVKEGTNLGDASLSCAIDTIRCKTRDRANNECQDQPPKKAR